ncbi:hypothetical protein ISF6_0546 [Piscinibacter sakaiensis]|uniref:Uncharacterized protein n=1 Tax=Piscinibacter sakaiensis TaxID=1547922 RepID=A0A0K8NX92_PISS1|nr:hypothetical protein ISF6_0546 [Piscinibacter sakaiensis]
MREAATGKAHGKAPRGSSGVLLDGRRQCPQGAGDPQYAGWRSAVRRTPLLTQRTKRRPRPTAGGRADRLSQCRRACRPAHCQAARSQKLAAQQPRLAEMTLGETAPC